MPVKKAGYSQVSLLLPDGLLAAVRKAAERDGLKVSPWICTVLAGRVGVDYTPPDLGRPVKQEKKPGKGRGR